MARFFDTKKIQRKLSAPKRVSARQAFTGLRKDPEALRRAAAASAMSTLQNKLMEAKRAKIAAQKLDTLSKVASGKRLPQRTPKRKPIDLNALLRRGVDRGIDVTGDIGRKAFDTGKGLAGAYYKSQEPTLKPTIDFVGGLIEERRKEIEPAFKPFTQEEVEATKARRQKPFFERVKEVQQNPRAQGIAVLSMDALDPSGTGLSKKAVQKALKAGARTIGSVPIGMGKKAAQKAGSELLEQATKKAGSTVARETGEEAVQKVSSKADDFNVGAYVQDLTKKQKEARGGVSETAQKAKDFYVDAKAKMVDFASPIEDVLIKAERKGNFEVLPEKHITNQIDRVLRTPSLAGNFVRKHGMEDVIRKVDSLEEFDQYLIAKHAQDVSSKVKNPRKFAIGETQIGKKADDLTSQLKSLINERKFKFQDTYKKVNSGSISTAKKASLRKKAIRDYRQVTNKIDTIKKELSKLDQQAKNLASQKSKALVETGRNLTKDAQLIEALAPKYEDAAQTVTKYSREILDYSVDSGLIGRELAESLKKQYPNYVPLQRVFDAVEKADMGSGKAIASRGKQNIVQKLKGSKREVESPIKSLLEKTVDAVKQGEQNKAARMLASYKDLPGNPFQLKEIKAGAKAPKNSFKVIEDGVVKTYETIPAVADAAKALDVQQMNILGQLFALPVRIAKVGITGFNPAFILSNFSRDQVTSAINSSAPLRSSIANPNVFLKSLFEAVKHGKVYDEMAEQAALGTSFDLARNQVVPSIARIRSQRSLGSRIKYTITHPNEIMRAAEAVVSPSEETTRIMQYMGTKQKALKSGMLPERARIQASRAARENSINFARHGEWGKVLNGAVLYLNAQIQGTRTFVRNMRNRPAQTAAKIAVTGFVPVTMLTAWNLSDPKRKEAYDDIAEYEKEGNFILIPPDPVKDEQGRWNAYKMPMSQEMMNLVTLVRRGIEQAHGKDPVSVQEIAKNLIGTVSPIEPEKNQILSTAIPQAVKPAIEANANYNFFTERPIVPDYLEEASPEMQAHGHTSGTARGIAGLFGAPPLKTEAFIKSTFGGVGEQTMNVSDQLLAKAGVIPKEQVGGRGPLESIVGRFSGARGGETERRESEGVNKALREQTDEDIRLREEAKIRYEELKKLPPEEANRVVKEIKKENEALYDKIKWRVVNDQSGELSPLEIKMSDLKVNNGARAQFIYNEIIKYPTPEEKNEYIKNLRKKGIITDKVFKQIKDLAKENG